MTATMTANGTARRTGETTWTRLALVRPRESAVRLWRHLGESFAAVPPGMRFDVRPVGDDFEVGVNLAHDHEFVEPARREALGWISGQAEHVRRVPDELPPGLRGSESGRSSAGAGVSSRFNGTASDLTIEEFEPPLDPGIRGYVEVLRSVGIETFESCQGGEGHCYPVPTVRFHGHRGEGFRALAVALERHWPASDLRRVWPVYDREPTGPYWELTFHPEGDEAAE
jgi:hypothetical protein